MFAPVTSPAVLNIVTYSFGSSPEATRADRVMRSPTTALLIQQRGTLYEHSGLGNPAELPRFALLGPSSRCHVWSTAANTRFTLVNLAPAAARVLFGIDPFEIRNQVETLGQSTLSAGIQETLAESRESLHRYLCSNVRERVDISLPGFKRTQAITSAIHDRVFGQTAGHYADAFGVTPRTLQRTVQTAVGLTAKQILAIGRIRRLVALTARGWSQTIADLAQVGGYFDQSHMRYELMRYQFGDSSDLVCGDHVVTQP